MAKRQNFVVGSTNPNTQSRTTAQLNNAWNQFEVLRSGVLDGVFNAVSDFSNDSSNEIANAIVELTGSQPTGATQTELASALRQMREDIETTSLTFKGYISATQPSSSNYNFQVGNIWIQSATLPTSFPVAIAGIWNGTQWDSTTETYTQKDFDFFRNVNDNEGYYWFGGEWTVMSTDMSTTYFSLNQTSGKWEIKDSVNLPGAPTVATPTAASPQTQIANKKYVDENISAITSDFDLFDTKWRDALTNNTRWVLSDGNWKTNANAYQHLVDDVSSGVLTTFYAWHSNYGYGTIYTLTQTPVAESDSYYKYQNGEMVRQALVDVVAADYSYIQDASSNSYDRNSAEDVQVEVSVPRTETIAGITITYYLAADGHKICLPAEESDINSLYSATGVAWYYILDTTNQQFKLPRTKFGFTGLRDTVGSYVEAGLPDITGNFEIPSYNTGEQSVASSGCFSSNQTGSGARSIGYADQFYNRSKTTFNASNSNSIYGGSTTVQPNATQMYLYFYVGLPAQV